MEDPRSLVRRFAVHPPAALARRAHDRAWTPRLGPVALVAAFCLFAPALARADGTAWIQRSPTAPPSARWDATLVYDANSDRMILFGGASSASDGSSPVYYNDVWAYSLATHQWSQLTTSGTPPGPSTGHTAIYDPIRDRMVVYGGNVPGVMALTLGGTPTWSTLSTQSGSIYGQRRNHVAIYDAGRDQMVVTGSIIQTDTWVFTFSNNQWTQLPNAYIGGSVGEEHGGAVYDPVNQRMLYFGGVTYGYGLLCQGSGPYPTNGVLSLDLTHPNASWVQLPNAPWGARGEISAVWDGVNHQAILIDGAAPYEVCHCGGDCCPYIVSDDEYPYADVWTFDVTTNAWSAKSPTGGPPAARGHDGAAYDPVREEVTMFGGGSMFTNDSTVDCLAQHPGIPVYTYRNDTWSFRPDAVPPAAVTDLQVHMYGNGAEMRWTAPGDDGTVGTAAQYIIKYSNSVITWQNFDGITTQVPAPAPTAAGTNQNACIDGLPRGTWYWFAMKTVDEAGNVSDISNIPSGRTTTIGPLIVCDVGGFRSGRPIADDAALSFGLTVQGANPVVGQADLVYSVPTGMAGAPLKLSLFDVLGRHVRTIASGTSATGSAVASWDLTDESGAHVHAGVYYARLTVGGQQLTRTVFVR